MKKENEMIDIHIFHHYDADGFGSAAVIGALHIHDDNKKVYFHVCNHKSIIDTSEINLEHKNIIYVVDYSFIANDIPIVENLLQNKMIEKFVWIDHHATTKVMINTSNTLEETLNKGGLFISSDNLDDDLNFAGIELCFYYVLQELGVTIYEGKNKRDSVFRTIRDYVHPKFIDLVGDHDLWKHKIDGSADFVKGCIDAGMTKTFIDIDDERSFINIMYKYIQHFFSSKGNSTAHKRGENPLNLSLNIETQLIEKGRPIREIDDRRNRSLLKNSFEISLFIDIPESLIYTNKKDSEKRINRFGKILCLNSYGNSSIFLDKFEEYGAVIIFNYDGELFKYSMFSKKEGGLPCDAVALSMNHIFGISGGGHEHASGWTTKDIIFKKNAEYTIAESTAGEIILYKSVILHKRS